MSGTGSRIRTEAELRQVAASENLYGPNSPRAGIAQAVLAEYDLIAKALPAILDAILEASGGYIDRCLGCGSWAWTERPCSTCARIDAARATQAS